MTNSAAVSNHYDPSAVETKELLYPNESTLDDVGVDPSTDPENVQLRTATRGSLPFWITANWHLSEDMKTLEPTALYLQQVLDAADPSKMSSLQTAGMREAGEDMFGRERASTTKSTDDKGKAKDTTIVYPSAIQSITTHYFDIIDMDTDNGEHFQITSQLSNFVNHFLARRAVSLVKVENANLKNSQETPEWFTAELDRKREAAAKAAKWMRVHEAVYSKLGYKGAPRYFTQYAVRQELRQNGRWLFQQHVASDEAKAKVADYKKFDNDHDQC